ncbi:hypothetical protein TNCV_55921 [Trichonephila clavipes]|nr:hypothetical protein TNCV_55921 [Trichonephila clavipes]
MRMKKEQKSLPEERYKKADEEAIVFKSERAQILNREPDAVAQPVAVKEEKGLSRDSSNVPPISIEDEAYEIKGKPKLPKRKLKELSRISVTTLQRKVNLKASNNIVLVSMYWSFKREYSQDKRIEHLLGNCQILSNELVLGRCGNHYERSRDNESQDEETS